MWEGPSNIYLALQKNRKGGYKLALLHSCLAFNLPYCQHANNLWFKHSASCLFGEQFINKSLHDWNTDDTQWTAHNVFLIIF